MVKYKSLIIKILIIIILAICLTLIIWPRQTTATKEDILTCNWQPTSDSPNDFHLPVIIIDTKNQKLDSDLSKTILTVDDKNFDIYNPTTKYKATMTMYDSCSSSVVLDENILISLRGQSSLAYPKKQYAITFIDDENIEKNVSILDMPASDKWILNGTYSDKLILRNRLAYQLGRSVMNYAPRTQYVEVFVKSDNEELSYAKHYQGLYLVTEKIKRDSDRVDISKADERYNDVSFIISRDKIKSQDTTLETYFGNLEEDYIIGTDNKLKLRSMIKAVYPSKEKLTVEYENKILKYLNEFETSLYSSDFKSETNGYRKYIDVKSFVDMAMINEIFKNIDGCEVSTYFYKDIGGLLTAGPIWDFDLSLGNTTDEEVNEPTGLRMVNTIWFNRLFQDEYFANMYQKRYEYLRQNVYSDDNILSLIDSALYETTDASARNYALWYSQSVASYNDEIIKLKNYMITRLHWLDENISNVIRYEDILE